MKASDGTGCSDWTRGFLSEADVRWLEEFDAQLKCRSLKSDAAAGEVRKYQEVVEDDPSRIPTHCEHGIPLNERCEICRAFPG